MDKIEKPITVARAEFINGVTMLINESGLPAFVIEPILKDMLYDIKVVAQKQLEHDTKIYQDKLLESDNKTNP